MNKSFFPEQLPVDFFTPLTSIHQNIYLQIILHVLRLRRSRFSMITRDELISHLMVELSDQLMSAAQDPFAAEAIPSQDVRDRANHFVRMLTQKGWLKKETRTQGDVFEEVYTIPKATFAIMQTLDQIMNNQFQVYQRHVYNTYLHLKELDEQLQRVFKGELTESEVSLDLFVDSWLSMIQFAMDLNDVLSSLLDNIRHFFDESIAHQSMRHMLEEFFNEYAKKVGDLYHNMKTRDNVHKYRSYIYDTLNQWNFNDKYIQWFRNHLDIRHPNWFEELRFLTNTFDNIPKRIKEIDREHSNYISDRAQKIGQLLHRKEDNKGLIWDLIQLYREKEDHPDALVILQEQFAVTSWGFVDELSIKKKAETKPDVPELELPETEMSDADHESAKQLFQKQTKHGVDKQVVFDYVMNHLNAGKEWSDQFEMDAERTFVHFAQSILIQYDSQAPYEIEPSETIKPHAQFEMTALHYLRKDDQA